MKEFRLKELIGGIFLILTAAIVIGLVVFVGGKHGLLEDKVTYSVLFGEVAGLQEGAEVKIAGVSVGFVKEISLVYRQDKPYVLVSAVILKRHIHQIRKDSVFALGTVGVLGDTILTVTAGSREQPQLPPGDEVIGASPYSLKKLTSGFEQVVEEIARFSSGAETFLNSSSQHLNRISPEVSATLGQVKKTAQALETTSDEVKVSGAETLAAVRDASKAVERLANDLDAELKKGKLLKFKVF